jgi:hypothetical protein
VVFAGQEYGTGSSRDWAAKGTRLLGVRAVIAESFERIHRSNLVGMGVLPCQFAAGTNAQTLGIVGNECFDLRIDGELQPQQTATLVIRRDGADDVEVPVTLRIDTPIEVIITSTAASCRTCCASTSRPVRGRPERRRRSELDLQVAGDGGEEQLVLAVAEVVVGAGDGAGDDALEAGVGVQADALGDVEAAADAADEAVAVGGGGVDGLVGRGGRLVAEVAEGGGAWSGESGRWPRPTRCPSSCGGG